MVFKFDATRGYNGNITLLAGVNFDGSLRGVRVTSHKETPGLGDGIEIEKDDWIESFSGKSLANPQPQQWAVRRDGGSFDQFTGATITPRAIVEAVRDALHFYAANRDFLFDTPSDSPEGDK